MGLFDSVLGAVNSQLQQQGGLANVLGGLLASDGGQGGLAAWRKNSTRRVWAS